jgi:hypothetical protein
MHSSIRNRHVGAFNRNGPTGTADCADRPRQKRADLILRFNTARRPHRGRSIWIRTSSHVSIGAFTAAIVASHPDNLIDYFVLEGFDHLSFEAAAGAGRKVFAYFGAFFDRVDRRLAVNV